MTPWPKWVSGAVGLACAITICAGIIIVGWWADNLWHAKHSYTESKQLGDGLWFCLNGTFGNGCWR